MSLEALQLLTVLRVEAIENVELPFTRWHCLLYRHIQEGCLQLTMFATRGEALACVKVP